MKLCEWATLTGYLTQCFPPGAQSLQYGQREQYAGHVCWHIFKIKVINVLYIQQLSEWSRGDKSAVTKVVRVERWDHYSLQVPRTLFGSQGLFVVPTVRLSLHPPVLPSSNDQEPGLQLLSLPLVYHAFEWFQGPCGICPQTLDSCLFLKYFIYLFIHDNAESSLLHKLFSSCNKQGVIL